MSRIRHIIKSFALLACLAFLLFSIGCTSSVVAPASGPDGVTTGSDNNGIDSTPDGPSQASFGDITG